MAYRPRPNVIVTRRPILNVLLNSKKETAKYRQLYRQWRSDGGGWATRRSPRAAFVKGAAH